MSILNMNKEQTTSAVNAAKDLFSSSNTTIKTPISLLQEICMKCHVQPIYEVLTTEGQIHDPTFVYKVSIGSDISAIGKGTSKKRAKHTAALAILNEIKMRSVGKNDQLATQIETLM
jgi:dsRNA-specific ribonuclease